MGLTVSDLAKDLIDKLLDKNPDTRIGAKGDIEEILAHPWFADLDRNKLLAKKVDPPFVP